ncbi:MAG TPA: efflux RND transporter permease subunit, partial [Vampirovibrionales bacterium]
MFTDYFIKRPIFAIVCSLVFVLGGLICIPLLPVAQFPDIAPAEISVSATYIGANAETVEAEVTNILEQEINGAEGTRYLTSSSSNNGSSRITLTLESGRNVEDALLDVQNRVKRAEARLPDDVRRTGVSVSKSSNALVMVFGLYSSDNKLDKYFISNYVDKYLRDALLRVNGVSEVNIFGERKLAMRVWLNPALMASYQLTPTDVINALREQNISAAAGQIGEAPYPDGQLLQMSVNAQSKLKKPEEFEDVVVKVGSQSQLIKLKDVGTVEFGAENYNSILRFNGNENAVGIAVYHLPSANTYEVGKNVEKLLLEMKDQLPPGLKAQVVFSSGQFVEESTKEVIWTLLQAIILVILVIFFFLQSWRSTLIPAITIPVSLIGTFIFIKIFGFSINTLTLFGITLSTGVVVDDAIVVLENISRFIEKKKLSGKDAASLAMKEIFSAVIATSLVLVAVFVPVALFPGTTGKLYREFALTITFSIAISTFNALTLSPALSALLLNNITEKKGRFFDKANAFIKGLSANYKKWLFGAFRKRAFILVGFVLCFLLALIGYRLLPSSFVPQDDRGYFIVAVQTPAGSSLDHTSKVISKVEKLIMQEPMVRGLFSVSGFSFLGSGSNKGMLFPVLKPLKERPGNKNSSAVIANKLRGVLMPVQEAFVLVFEPPAIRGLGNFGGFQGYLTATGTGITLDDLAQQAKTFSYIGNSKPEISNFFSSFTSDSPELFIEVDREKAKAMNINLSEIFRTLQAYLGGVYVNDFSYANKNYRV